MRIIWGRSIPACAGEPSRLPRRPTRLWVYPRVCGGTIASLTHERYPRGLSPRVRGNLCGGCRCVPRNGSIPACAGEPSCYTCPALT